MNETCRTLGNRNAEQYLRNYWGNGPATIFCTLDFGDDCLQFTTGRNTALGADGDEMARTQASTPRSTTEPGAVATGCCHSTSILWFFPRCPVNSSLEQTFKLFTGTAGVPPAHERASANNAFDVEQFANVN